MKILLAASCAFILAIGIYMGLGAREASAFSPDIQVIENEQTDIGLDIGYFYDDLISADSVRLSGQSDLGHWHAPPPAHHSLPGVSDEEMRLMHSMRQAPTQFLTDVRAEVLAIAGIDDPIAPVPTSATELPWVADGLDENEALTLELFGIISQLNPAAAERIAVMPFLQTFGTADLEAVWSLARIAFTDFRDETMGLNEVLDNPHLSDGGGIDDEEAKIVAVVGGTYQFEPKLVPDLLDPSETLVHEYRLHARGKTIHMTVIRFNPGSPTTDDLFRNAVHQLEQIMDLPLRTDYVAVLVSSDALPSFAAAAHFGTHITLREEYDTDDRTERPGSRGPIVIAHEMAHYYWFNDVELWIDEGAADFIAALVENRRIGREMEPDTGPCSYYDGVFHLSLAQPSFNSWGGLCHYSLGERAFHDLYANMDEQEFFAAFRALYATASAENAGEIHASQHFLTPFFPADLTGTDETIRRMVLSRRYGEVINSDLRPVNPRIAALNGTVIDAVILKVSDGIPVGSYEGFFTLPNVNTYVHRLALVIEHDEPLPADVELTFGTLEYYQDGFVFDRQIVTETFEAGAHRSIAVLSGIGFIPNYSWPPGLYWVYAYHGGQKIAELYFDVAP